MVDFSTASELLIRSGNIDPLRTAPVRVDRDLYSFIQHVTLRDFFSLDGSETSQSSGWQASLFALESCGAAVVFWRGTEMAVLLGGGAKMQRSRCDSLRDKRDKVCRSSLSRRGKNLPRTAHLLIFPLSIGVQNAPRVVFARVRHARSSRRTVPFTHWGHDATCRSGRSGNWRRTRSTVSLRFAPNHRSGTAACLLFREVQLWFARADGTLTGRLS